MTLRSVLEVDVDASKFDEFQAAFKKYQDALDRMPGAWGKVNEQTSKVRSEFADMAAAMLAQVELLARVNRETDRFEGSTRTAGTLLGDAARGARDIATHIGNATRDILRWTGITTAVGGLLGLGSIFGLEALASGAGNLRRTASGLGFAPGNAGSMTSFNTNLSRLIDPQQFLGGVNQALNDVTQRWTLYSAGLGEGQLHGRDTGQVSLALLQSAWRTIQGAPEGQLAQVMQSHGLQNFLSLQDATRLKQTPYSEIQEVLLQQKTDASGMAITDQTLKAWQEFDVQLNRAGNTIWSVFVAGMGPLIPKLTEFSVAIENYAIGGMKQFFSWIDTDEGKKSLDVLWSNVASLGSAGKDMADGVIWIADQIRKLKGSDTTTVAELGGAGVGAWLGARFGPWGAAIGGLLGLGVGYKSSEGSRGLSSGERAAMQTWEHMQRPLTQQEQQSLDALHARDKAHPSSSFNVPSGTDVDVIKSTVASAGGNEKTQAAFLAMFNAEDSGLSPSLVEHGVGGSAGVGGRGGASYAQWTGSRRRQLESFGWTGTDAARDRIASARMLQWELTTNPQFKDMVGKMNASPLATDAAIIGGRTYEQGGADAGLFGGGGHDQAFMDRYHSSQAEKFYRTIQSPVPAYGESWHSADTYNRFHKTATPVMPHVSVTVTDQTGGSAHTQAAMVPY